MIYEALSHDFQALVAFADAQNVSFELMFTAPSEPLCINAEFDGCQILSVISTTQVREEVEEDGRPANNSRAPTASAARKRLRENEEPQTSDVRGNPRKSMKVVQKMNEEQESQLPYNSSRSAPISSRPLAPSQPDPVDGRLQQAQPLFLASQNLSQVHMEAIAESGLGLENMNAEEFAAMLDDEGVDLFEAGGATMDVETLDSSGDVNGTELEEDQLEYTESELGPTQASSGSDKVGSQSFPYPMFLFLLYCLPSAFQTYFRRLGLCCVAIAPQNVTAITDFCIVSLFSLTI